MGWDNSTELLATVVDSLTYIARLIRNANFNNPDSSEIPRVVRPHEDEISPQRASLNDFAQLMRGE